MPEEDFILTSGNVLHRRAGGMTFEACNLDDTRGAKELPGDADLAALVADGVSLCERCFPGGDRPLIAGS